VRWTLGSSATNDALTDSRKNDLDHATALFALAAVVAFALVCTAVQFLRSDLAPANAPLSMYLTGDFGGIVRAVYYMLAVGLIALAWATFRASDTTHRSEAPALLFVAAGVALIPVAATAPLSIDGPHADFARFVHGVAAQTTFLCVTVAMLLQSVRWWRDASFANGRLARLILAALAFAALWVNVLNRQWPRGLVQKALIVMILIWLGAAAWQAARVLPRR